MPNLSTLSVLFVLNAVVLLGLSRDLGLDAKVKACHFKKMENQVPLTFVEGCLIALPRDKTCGSQAGVSGPQDQAKFCCFGQLLVCQQPLGATDRPAVRKPLRFVWTWTSRPVWPSLGNPANDSMSLVSRCVSN